MDILETLHLERRDFQSVIALAVIDLGLTIPGIAWNGGGEMSPFYDPFTSSLEMMLLGAGIYIVILIGFNLLLKDDIRTILAATALGMHLSGIYTWITFYMPLDPSYATDMYLRLMFVSLGTAVSYWFLLDKGWQYPQNN